MMNEPNKDLLAALWSVKEDAMHAWKLALGGDDSGLSNLGTSIKHLESVVTRQDYENKKNQVKR